MLITVTRSKRKSSVDEFLRTRVDSNLARTFLFSYMFNIPVARFLNLAALG